MEITPEWISNVGFPAAAFLLLYRLICGGLDRNTEAIREMTAALSELRASLVCARFRQLPRDMETRADGEGGRHEGVTR